jgi:hypothetical protein
VLLFPVLDGLVISLQGALLGFLWAPIQAVQQTADLIPMVLNSELAVDQFRNASRHHSFFRQRYSAHGR